MANGKWIIFDADNTLWDLESIYDAARREFCTYTLDLLNQSGQNSRGAITIGILEQSQRHRDLQLNKTHGYSSSRFSRSFEDTLMFFYQYAPPETVIHVRSLAERVFETRARPVDDLEEVLRKLHPVYSLAIMTAGERWVQQKRLDEFNLSGNFDKIIIVERKTPLVFEEFCTGEHVDAKHCWVVGDSVRSDVLPAKEAGLNQIHVKAPNWAAEDGNIPEGTPSVNRLKDILELLL